MFFQDKILCADGMAWENDKFLKSLCVFIWTVLAHHMLLQWKGFWISWHDYIIIFCTLVWLFCFWSGRLWGLASFLKEKLWCFTSFKTDKHLQCFFCIPLGLAAVCSLKYQYWLYCHCQSEQSVFAWQSLLT